MAANQRLIDANELRTQFDDIPPYIGLAGRLVQQYIDNAPTVAAVEVVHGRWEHNEYGLQCSKCACDSLYNGFSHPVRSAFCPNCGAVMEDEYNEAID